MTTKGKQKAAAGEKRLWCAFFKGKHRGEKNEEF
jgi:hypothetical protein